MRRHKAAQEAVLDEEAVLRNTSTMTAALQNVRRHPRQQGHAQQRGPEQLRQGPPQSKTDKYKCAKG